jgi:predicted outer membrane repeat protein
MYIGLVNGDGLEIEFYCPVLYGNALENLFNQRNPEVQTRTKGTVVFSKNSGGGNGALLHSDQA